MIKKNMEMKWNLASSHFNLTLYKLKKKEFYSPQPGYIPFKAPFVIL